MHWHYHSAAASLSALIHNNNEPTMRLTTRFSGLLLAATLPLGPTPPCPTKP